MALQGHVVSKEDPVEKPVTIEDAPILSLRELVPLEERSGEKDLDETMKVGKIEMILMQTPELSLIHI